VEEQTISLRLLLVAAPLSLDRLSEA